MQARITLFEIEINRHAYGQRLERQPMQGMGMKVNFAMRFRLNEAIATLRKQAHDAPPWARACITVEGMSRHYPAHLAHTIDHPRMVHVGYTPEGEISSLLIVAPDKTETLVRLRPRSQQAAWHPERSAVARR